MILRGKEVTGIVPPSASSPILLWPLRGCCRGSHTLFAASIAILYYYIALSRVEAAMAIECVAEKMTPFLAIEKTQLLPTISNAFIL